MASPASGDEVVGTPAEIVLDFSQDLDVSRSSIVVSDADGAVVRGGELGDGPRQLRLALPELPPGEYEVRWTSFSAEDSELERGSYDFTILPSPTAAPTAAPTEPPATATPAPLPTGTAASLPTASPVPAPPDPAADAGVIVPIAVAFVAGIGALAWLLRRRTVS